MLTGKERLTRLFKGQEIDRIPIWLQFPYFVSPYYANIFEISSYKPILDDIYRYTEIIDRQLFDTGFAFSGHPDIRKELRHYKDNSFSVSETIISYKDVELKSTVKKSADSTVIEPFIKKIEDLEKILQLPYLPPRPNLNEFLSKGNELGDRGLMGVDLKDPLSVLHDLCDESEFTIYIHTEFEKVKVFLDILFERVFDAYTYLLENGVGPVYWISGAEFAVPPMVSPAYFDDLVTNYTKQLCELIRSYGCWSMIHCHGKISKVLSSLKQIGFDSIHPIEAPPMGDCTLTDARNIFGRDTILVGNIQLGDLWEKSEEEMEHIVKETLKEGNTGRFILATTGGPSAPEINGTVVKNYLRIIETAKTVT